MHFSFMPKKTTEEYSFRDRPINIDASGKRKWVYARQPRGKWYTRRTLVGWMVLLFLVTAPFIRIKGLPFMKFDIPQGEFYLFGSLLYTQDTYLLAIIMAIAVVSVVLFTVAFGRLFCGWLCPQTIFLEIVYRRIEYLFMGNYRKGKLKEIGKFKRLGMHLSFMLISVVFTNVFLMWFIGPEGLARLIQEPVQENLKGFSIMLGISAFYYWIYSNFREQVCTMICPYGRMQGVLLDSQSISVIYDYKRGEPRGAKNVGDCIDCSSCLAVCPTGIDIRNGTQLECIHCTACIDECNSVMKRIQKPYNLIRYDSVKGIETGKRSVFTTRTLAYAGVLFVLFIFLAFTVSRRTSLDVSLLRMPGSLYQQPDEQTVMNLYNLKLINKSENARTVEVLLLSPEGIVEVAGKPLLIESRGHVEAVLMVKINKATITGKNTDLRIGFFDNQELLETTSINFIGPTK